MRAFHACAFRTDFGKVVANTAAASHGFRRLQQRRINPRFAVRIYFRHRIADRLYKTVDQRGLNIRSRRRIDASAGDEAAFERAVKILSQLLAQFRLFTLGQRARHTLSHLLQRRLVAFGIFLDQHLAADVLFGGSGQMGDVVEMHEKLLAVGSMSEALRANAARGF